MMLHTFPLGLNSVKMLEGVENDIFEKKNYYTKIKSKEGNTHAEKGQRDYHECMVA
jgi:hypothetical protein